MSPAKESSAPEGDASGLAAKAASDASTAREPGANPAATYLVLTVAALAAGLAEGVQGVGAAYAASSGARAAMLVFWQAFGAVALPVLALAFPLGALLDLPSTRAFLADLRAAITGDRDGATTNLALLAAVLIFAGATTLATFVGRASKDRLSVNVTVTVTVVACAVAFALLLPAVALAMRALSPWLRRAMAGSEVGSELLAGGAVPATVLCSAVTFTLLVLLPFPFVVTIASAVFALALGALEGGREVIGAALRGRRGPIVYAVALLASLGAPLTLDRMPSSVGLLVLYRSPVAGAILVGARSLVDADHDGYSPILLGGDCDDHDPTINPGARDIPNNGIDENCSGGDSKDLAEVPQAAVKRPDGIPPHDSVVMIIVDALRPDHLSFAGYKRPTSPNIDRFRKTATWFENAYTSAPSTRFALTSLFTGMEIETIPQRRGPGIDLELLPGATTLATRLGDIGYERMGFTDSYVVQHIRGLGAGFGRWETPWPVDEWAANYPVSGTKTTNAAIEWLHGVPEDGSKRYFLFLHYRCTHDPYGKNARWTYGTSAMDDYDSALSYCDDEIGRLLEKMETRKDKDATAIFLFSDHGELFGEHGFTNHGNTLFQPDVRSLLLVRVPGLRQVPTVTAPVSLVDMEPTTLMLAGAPPDRETRAWNLLPFLTEGDAAANPARPLFLYSDLTKGMVRHQARAVLLGKYKLIRDLSTGVSEMYDIEADPQERTDESSKHPAQRTQLGEALEGWERQMSLHRNISIALPPMPPGYPGGAYPGGAAYPGGGAYLGGGAYPGGAAYGGAAPYPGAAQYPGAPSPGAPQYPTRSPRAPR